MSVEQHQHISVSSSVCGADGRQQPSELACQLHTLRQQVAEYVIEEALKEEQKNDNTEEIEARAALLLDPSTAFADRFEAVMNDMLSGTHISQTEPSDPGLFRAPTDIEENDSNPTEEH